MTSPFRLNQQEITALCRAGNHAPSGGNAQPWLVVIQNEIFEVFLNPNRSESFLDVKQYASFFAVGCFAQNILLCAQALGLTYALELLTPHKPTDPIVRFTFTDRENKKSENLAMYINDRMTNRQLSDGSVLTAQELASLTRFNQNAIAQVHFLSSFDDKRMLAEITSVADGIRVTNEALFTQMMAEFRWTTQETRETQDGLDLNTLEMPPNLATMFQLLRHYPFARELLPRKAFEGIARPLFLGSSHLGCLALTEKLTPKSMMQAGMIMENIWLTATKLHISLQPWSVSTFLLLRAEYFTGKGLSKLNTKELLKMGTALRKIYSLNKTDTPVFLFRLSHTKDATAKALRIPWESYTTIRTKEE